MTKIKLCGMRRIQDIDYANMLSPDFIGFVFAPSSKRYVTFGEAGKLRERLKSGIIPVGVFVDEPPENIIQLIRSGIINAVQLHGSEDNEYIKALRTQTNCSIIQAFKIKSSADTKKAQHSAADFVMTDSGAGSGKVFDYSLLNDLNRDFFLAGGLDAANVRDTIQKIKPYAVDASSSLETDGVKDINKMTAFVNAVRYGKDEKK